MILIHLELETHIIGKLTLMTLILRKLKYPNSTAKLCFLHFGEKVQIFRKYEEGLKYHVAIDIPLDA